MKKTIKNLSWAMCLCASTLISCSGRKIHSSGQVGGNARNNNAFLQRLEQQGTPSSLQRRPVAPQTRALASTSTNPLASVALSSAAPRQTHANTTSFSILNQPGMPDCTAEILPCTQQTSNTCGYHMIKNAAIIWSHEGSPRDIAPQLRQLQIQGSTRANSITITDLQNYITNNRRNFLHDAQVIGRSQRDAVDTDITAIRDEFTNVHEIEFLAQLIGIDDNARSIFHPDFISTHTNAERDHARQLLTTPNTQHLFLVNNGNHWFLIAAHRTATKINFFVIDSAIKNKNILHYHEYITSVAEYIQGLA